MSLWGQNLQNVKNRRAKLSRLKRLNFVSIFLCIMALCFGCEPIDETAQRAEEVNRHGFMVVVDGVETVPENAVLYGAFIQRIIDFLIIALCIFVVLKVFLAMQERTKKLLAKKVEEEAAAEEEAAPAETEMDVLKDIRALLAEKAEK